MAIALKKTFRSGGGGGGRNISYNAPLLMTADRNGERAICELQVDAYGMKAGDKVALVLTPAKPVAPGKKARPELKNFRSGGRIGTSPKFGDDVLIIAERSYKDNRETIDGLPVVKANWIRAAVHDMSDPGPASISYGFVNVGTIRERKNKDGEVYFTQNRGIYMANDAGESEAFGFNSMDEFKNYAAESLNAVGTNGEVIVRVTNNDAVLSGDLPEGEVEMLHRSLRLYWHRDEQRQMTIEESIDFFLDGPEKLANGSDNPDYGLWRSFVAAAGTPDGEGLSFDAVINRTAPTGSSTLENMLEKRRGQADFEERLFNIPTNGEYTERVFIKGSLILRAQPLEDNPDEFRIIATDTFALDSFGPTYLAGELPGARPAEVQAVFDARAKERGEKRANELFSKNDSKKDKVEEMEQDENDPAPSSLTPAG